VLDNDFVHYAEMSPHALAAALVEVCSLPDFASRSAAAAASMQRASWDDAGATVERVLYRELAAC
jgi:hypothetical protein